MQHKAAKFVTNIYPKKGHYEEFSIQRILKSLGWESLEERRNQIRLNMVYKILNNHVIIPPELLPRFNNIRPPRRCAEPHVGVKHHLVEPLGRTDIISNTFFFGAPKLWNDCVTPAQASATSFDSFKNHFMNH